MVGAHGGRNMVCVSMFMLVLFCFLLIFEWGVINLKKPQILASIFQCLACGRQCARSYHMYYFI